MISFDTDNIGAVTTIGSHGLPEDLIIYNPVFNPPNGRVYATGSRYLGNGVYESSFLEFNLSTGAGSVVRVFGTDADEHEALTYSNALGSLVASRRRVPNGGTVTRELGTMSTLGVFSFLSDNGLDNDIGIYDARRDLFYTMDVEGTNVAVRVNLINGSTSPGGSILQHLRAAAWSRPDDVIYGVMENRTEFVRLATGTVFTPTTLGTLPVAVTGIFVVPCAADYDHNGVVNSQDFFVFIADFFASDPAADFNHDGTITSQDFFDFLVAFFAGCP